MCELAGCSVAIYRVYVHVIKETGLHHYNALGCTVGERAVSNRNYGATGTNSHNETAPTDRG